MNTTPTRNDACQRGTIGCSVDHDAVNPYSVRTDGGLADLLRRIVNSSGNPFSAADRKLILTAAADRLDGNKVGWIAETSCDTW